MSRMLHICVDDETYDRLYAVSIETGRSVEDLAESAVEEAALESAKTRGDYRGSNN